MTRTLRMSWLLGAMGAVAVGCGQSHVPDDGLDAGRPDAAARDASSLALDGALDGGFVTTTDSAASIDASGPTPCTGLGPAECMAMFTLDCVPEFDDACCPVCAPGGPCADCTNPTYVGCVPRAESSCLGGPHCGTAPPWACGPAAPVCETAHVVDVDSCDRVGCVPAYPSGDGEPVRETAICVGIVANSCTVACRRIAPPCPTGTVAEGDGSCYTDRCIPAFVCD